MRAPRTSQASVVEDLPPRSPWEEPPPPGWTSGLSSAGLELGLFVSSLLGAAALVRLMQLASRLGHHAVTGPRQALAALAWAAACVLGAALAVYVWRRSGGIALLGAMLTDYRRAARLRGRPPVWLDVAPERGLRIAHLSDLHVAEGKEVRLIERKRPAGNLHLDRLLDAPDLAEAELLLFTGDVTDRGTARSWRCFLDALEERKLVDRTVLVPGNHDLGLLEPLGRGQPLREDRFGIVQLANLLKFSEAFAATLGGRLGLVLPDGKTPRPYSAAWEEIEAEARPFIASLPSMEVPQLGFREWRPRRAALRAYVRQIEVVRSRLLSLFPVAVPLTDRNAVIFVLNSASQISRHPTLNAIGHVGRAQYRRLERLAEATPARLRLVAVHHHLVRRLEEQGSDWKTRLFAKFTVLDDPAPLVRFCQQRGVRAVMHGHRHLSYQLRLPNGTVILAAPSSTFGDELTGDPRSQFELYDFAPDADDGTVGIHRTPVRLRNP